jgi:hypothetical protein
MEENDMNFLRRVLSLIEDNARLATQGSWGLDHGHVIGGTIDRTKDGKLIDRRFDVAAPPWERRNSVRAPSQDTQVSFANMRHIATCQPKTMIRLVEVVRKLMEENQPRLEDLQGMTLREITKSQDREEKQR